MMLLKLGLVLLTGICSLEVANLGCNMYWHFCFRSSPARSVPAPALTALTAAGAGSSYSQSSRGVNETWHLPCSHTSSQRFQGQSPGPEGSLLTETKNERGFAKTGCCLLHPVARCCQRPVLPQGDVYSPLTKLRSLNGIHVSLMRGLENSIIPGLGFSIKPTITAFNYLDSPERMREAGFPTEFPAAPASPSFPISLFQHPSPFLTVSVLVPPRGWATLNSILSQMHLFLCVCVSDRDVLSSQDMDSAFTRQRGVQTGTGCF